MRFRRARRRLARGDFVGVTRECSNILAVLPDSAEAYFLLGIASAHGRKFRTAVELIQKAISLDDGRASYHAALARCLISLNYHQRALNAASHAAELLAIGANAADPIDQAETLDTIGNVFSRVGRHLEANRAFSQAASLAPSNADIQFNLGSSHKFVGRFSEARAAYEKAISTRPNFYRAHWALSELVEATPDVNHIEKLEKELGSDRLSPTDKQYVGHALAKEYEDLGEYETAFKYLELSKSYGKSGRDTPNDDREIFEAITRVCTREFCAEDLDGHSSREPIFIVGMPRTGTTLIESILSTHQDVFAAGELAEFGRAVKRASQSTSRRLLDCQTVERAGTLNFTDLGAAYIEGARPFAGGTRHFIDKLPANFLYAGFIKRALPNAKIICLRRNPLDTCLSNFRCLFSRSSPYYDYTYDLLDTGNYYLKFDALVRHWERVLGANFRVVCYEDVVSDLEAQARKLLEFCNLCWDPSVLKFEDRDTPVATASAVQVRRRINSKPIGRWKSYRTQLEPLIKLFESCGIKCT